MSANGELARLTVRGTVWIYAANFASKGLVFAANILLARLLRPEDFGLLALGLVTIGYLDTFGDFGAGNAVIYRQEDPEATAEAAFWISLAAGLLLTALGLLGAPWVAGFFHQPELVPLVRALSFAVLISSLSSVQSARLKKSLDFRRRFLPETSRAVVKGLASILLALAGLGVWSLVWGHLIGWGLTTLLYWWLSGWRPSLRPPGALGPASATERRALRAVLDYGGQMVLLGLLSQLIMNLDYVMIGRRLDAGQLGFYTVAFRVPELIILNLSFVVSQVVFPAYARLQADPLALGRGYLATLRYVALATLPAGIGMLLIAPEFVSLFYGPRWSPAAAVMQVLALYTVVYSLSFHTGDVYKATGRPGLLNAIAVVRLAVTAPLLWVAAGRGILWVAWVQLAANVVISAVQIVIARRILGLAWPALLGSLRPAALGTLALLLAGLGLRLAAASLAAPARLALIVGGCAAVYAGFLWLAHRPLLLRAAGLLAASIGGPRPAAPLAAGEK